MEYTRGQARKIAEDIFGRFGGDIARACSQSHVSAEFPAGFVGVEAGKDKAGRIVPAATRFEAGVFAKLVQLRNGRRRKPYQGLNRGDLAGRSDAELRVLATSHGPAQIMGWQTIKNLKRSIADLSDPKLMFVCAVELLEIVGGAYIRRGEWAAVMRIWNTGRAGGKTFDEDYVANALAVMAAYKQISRGVSVPDPAKDLQDIPEKPATVDPERSSSDPATDAAAETQNENAGDPSSAGSLAGEATAALDRLQGAVDTLGAPIDAAGKISESVGRRVDAVKSTRATLGGLLWQAFWAIAGFLIGLPWYVWLAVLAIGGVITLAYLFRQTLLGYVREKKV